MVIFITTGLSPIGATTFIIELLKVALNFKVPSFIVSVNEIDGGLLHGRTANTKVSLSETTLQIALLHGGGEPTHFSWFSIAFVASEAILAMTSHVSIRESLSLVFLQVVRLRGMLVKGIIAIDTDVFPLLISWLTILIC